MQKLSEKSKLKKKLTMTYSDVYNIFSYITINGEFMVAGRGGLGFNPGAYNWDIVLVSKKMGIKDEHVQPMGGEDVGFYGRLHD